MGGLQILVGGRWLVLDCLYGDVEMSTVWPGGSDQLSWTQSLSATLARFEGGELVEARFGGAPVWVGTLAEPDPSQDHLTAQGAWHDGERFVALDAVGAATKVPDTAIDQAIVRGLTWTRPNSIASAGLGNNIDISQGPVTVGALIDVLQDTQAIRWGVNPYREVYTAADPTSPTYQTLPLDGGLGYALDNYASTLIGRYLDSTTSTFKTVTVTDALAESLHGDVENVIDLVTGRGALSAAAATTILNSALTLGRSTPQWTQSIEVTYGELLTMGGTPVALETVAAGAMVRVQGGFELAQRQNGAMYIDVLIGRTQLAGGTLTLQPLLVATRTFQDFVTKAITKH